MKLLAKDREELEFIRDMANALPGRTYIPCHSPFRDLIWRLGVVAVALVTLSTTTTSAFLFHAEAIDTHLLARLILWLVAGLTGPSMVTIGEHWQI